MTDEPQNHPDKTSLKQNLRTGSTWMRALFMVLFLIIYGIAEFLIFAVMAFQFLSVLFARKTNGPLMKFGKSLSAFIYEIMLYLTYNSEDRPFPFAPWPGEADGAKPSQPLPDTGP